MESIAELITVVAFVSDQSLGVRQRRIKDFRSRMVAHLAFREKQGHGSTVLVSDGVKLGVQPAFCPPDTAWRAPFFSRLAAVRWALRWVLSIMILSGFGPSEARL